MKMKRILRWLLFASQGFKMRILFCTGMGVLEVLFGLLFIWASMLVIDIATGTTDGNLYYAAFYTIGLMLLQLLLRALDTWMSGKLQVDVSNHLRRRFFSSLLQSRWNELERFHTGDVLNRIGQDLGEVVRLLTVSLPILVITLVQLIASFLFFCYLDSILAWILVGIMPLLLIMSKLYTRRMRRFSHEIKQSDSRINAVIEESIRHRVVIKTLEHEHSSMQQLEGLQGGLRSQVMKRMRTSLFLQSVVAIGFSSGYLVAFLRGAIQLSAGLISFGAMTAFLQLVGKVQRPALDLMKLLPSFITTYTSIERLIEIEMLPVEEEGEGVVFAGKVELRFDRVAFSYGEAELLREINFDFKPGVITALTGETGAGKTTLIRLILGLIKPTSGQILLKTDNRQIEISNLTRGNFVYVPQGNTLFSGTIRDNLLMGDDHATDKQLKEVLRVAVADFVLALPEGMDTVLNEQGGGLSEGQAQRIAIARALLRPGSILLLDESTSALDHETEQLLLYNLKVFAGGKTIIFITHHRKLVEWCDAEYTLSA